MSKTWEEVCEQHASNGGLGTYDDITLLIAEINRLRADLKDARAICEGLAARVAAQSEIIAKCAEKPPESVSISAGTDVPRRGDLYQHYKGGLYTFDGTAKLEATGEVMAVYTSQDGSFQSWVRPLEQWFDHATVFDASLGTRLVAPRFVKVLDAA